MSENGNHNDSDFSHELEKHMPELRRTILRDELLTEFLTERTTTRVTEKIIQRENRRQLIWTLIVAMLAAVGVAGSTAVIDNMVNNALNSDTTKQIVENISREQLGRVAGSLRDEITVQGQFQALSYLAFSLDFKPSFSNTERDSVVALLVSLSKETSVVDRSEFPAILQKVLISLASADQLAQINEIVDAYPKHIFNNGEIAVFLTDIYGRHFLYSRANKLRDAEQLEGIFSRLKISSESHDFQGALKPWQIGIDLLSLEARKSGAAVRRHIDEIIYLGTTQKAQALILLFTHQQSEWYQKSRDKTTPVVTQIFAELFAEYGADVGKLVSGEDGQEIVRLVVEQLIGSESTEAVDPFMEWAREFLD